MGIQKASTPGVRTFRVGEEFEYVQTCDRYRPIYYGAASGDFNAIHIDDEVARRAGLPGVILQGMCTLAWAAEAMVRFVGDPARVSRVNVRFSRPVLVDDVVTFRGKVVSIEGGKMSAELSATNQRGEEVLKNTLVQARVD